MLTRRSLAAVAVASSVWAGQTFAVQPEVIYGEDDRMDLYDTRNDPFMVELARSTAMLIQSASVTPLPDGSPMSRVPSNTYGDAYGLCEDEPFRDQPNPGFCSGFLVGPDVLVTAGHCISESTCGTTSFVFGFGYESEDQDVTLVPQENLYSCAGIMAREMSGMRGSDYAVVRLDRPVEGRTPLSFRREGKPDVGTPLVVIGHPAGLPTKIAGGAYVRSNAPSTYFVANLDTYGGNSGSAVLNALTGEVEGILVRGETDFVSRRDANGNLCRTSNVCPDDGCRGEDVTLAAEFARHVP